MNSMGHTHVASTAPAIQPLAMAVTELFDFFAILVFALLGVLFYSNNLVLLSQLQYYLKQDLEKECVCA
jgi:hypothetical protein